MADRLIDEAAAIARVRETPAIDADGYPAFRLYPREQRD
jgi:hypothetical protein